MKKYVLLSVKEQYANRILDGSKTIELRKSRPNVSSGDFIIIYCTSPIKAIVGLATIQEIINYPPGIMWKLHSEKLGINKADYLNYYDNKNNAIGIVLKDVVKLSDKIYLNNIKRQLPKFSPPQTYRYFTEFNLTKKNQNWNLIP